MNGGSMDTGFYHSKSESLYLRQKSYILSKTKQVNSPDKGCTCFLLEDIFRRAKRLLYYLIEQLLIVVHIIIGYKAIETAEHFV